MNRIIEEEEILTESKILLRSSCNFFGYIIFSIISLFIIIFLLWACIFKVDVVVNGNGTIVSNERTIITNNIEGTIKETYIVDGEEVNKGQTLFVLNSDELNLTKDQEEKKLNSLQKELSNYMKLKESFINNENLFSNVGEEELFYNKYYLYISSEINQLNMLIDVENNINILNDKLTALKNYIDKIDKDINAMTILSDRDGYISSSKQYRVGDKLPIGNTGISIIDNSSDKFNVDIYIQESEISKVEENQEVKVKLNSLDYREYGAVIGKVKSISSNSVINNNKSNYYLVKAEIPNIELSPYEGSAKTIKDGMSCSTNIITEKRRIIYYLLDKVRGV
ncbi:HlyD family secretion protein [Clostridium paraputrificum]|uniref:HlyD family secretion protein n=1 Tax=Clostridium paraputrificum TaxID=29363 RepID=UPI003D343315